MIFILLRSLRLRLSLPLSIFLLVAGMAFVPHVSVAEGSGPSSDATADAAATGSVAPAAVDAVVKAKEVVSAAKISVQKPVTATVRVTTPADATDSNEGYERRITSLEVDRSAGTFGDPMRFMQMLPGVVSDNDERNDFIVRGGNPSETLFVIDNI